MRVVRHVEHAQEADAPRVAVRVALPQEHRQAAIDAQSDLGITARPEDGQGAGVRIDEGDLLRRHREHRSLDITGIMQEERKPGLITLSLPPCQRQ